MKFLNLALRSSWSGRFPVTEEIVGSSPISAARRNPGSNPGDGVSGARYRIGKRVSSILTDRIVANTLLSWFSKPVWRGT